MGWTRRCSTAARSRSRRASSPRAVWSSAASVAAELGCEYELANVETMLSEGTGADLQRRAFAEGGMDGLLTFLIETTAEPVATCSRA